MKFIYTIVFQDWKVFQNKFYAFLKEYSILLLFLFNNLF